VITKLFLQAVENRKGVFMNNRRHGLFNFFSKSAMTGFAVSLMAAAMSIMLMVTLAGCGETEDGSSGNDGGESSGDNDYGLTEAQMNEADFGANGNPTTTNLADLYTLLSANEGRIPAGNYIVSVDGEIDLDDAEDVSMEFTPADGAAVTISLRGANNACIKKSSAGELFVLQIVSGVKVILRDITLEMDDQGGNPPAVDVLGGGTLVLESGAVITGGDTGLLVVSDNATPASVTMNGGKIHGNKMGVAISTNGFFTMTGGEIYGNTSYGGVYVSGGTFRMRGGEIYGNACTTAGYSGGVTIDVSGIFTKTGGTIYGGEAGVKSNSVTDEAYEGHGKAVLAWKSYEPEETIIYRDDNVTDDISVTIGEDGCAEDSTGTWDEWTDE
jgi:hypothetical protein